MTVVAPVLSPRSRRSGDCCAMAVPSDLGPGPASRLAAVAKALGDPTRLRIVDVIRRSAPDAVCQCELVPLFDMTQPGLAKHLRVLVDAGVLGSQRRGTWTYYYAHPGGLEELTAWLS